MARDFDDDVFFEAEDEQDGDSGEQKDGGGRRGLLFLLMLLLLGVIVLVIVLVLFISNRSQKDKLLASAKERLNLVENLAEPGAELLLFDAGDIYANIMGEGMTRVLKVRPYFEVSEPKLLNSLFAAEMKADEEDDADKGTNLYMQLRDEIMDVIHKTDYEELVSANGPGILKDHLRTAVNRMLRNRMEGAVITIYFDEYNIQ